MGSICLKELNKQKIQKLIPLEVREGSLYETLPSEVLEVVMSDKSQRKVFREGINMHKMRVITKLDSLK